MQVSFSAVSPQFVPVVEASRQRTHNCPSLGGSQFSSTKLSCKQQAGLSFSNALQYALTGRGKLDLCSMSSLAATTEQNHFTACRMREHHCKGSYLV